MNTPLRQRHPGPHRPHKPHGPHRLWAVALLAMAVTVSPAAWAQKEVHPTMKVRDLPEVLRAQWNQTRPEMQSTSRCAAAFDNYNDYDRMTLRCSIYIKIGAEGARRAMRYCEEDREKKRIHAPCKIVLEE